ncbi:hypothetical protein HY639_04870 [Candidatus Woesearchaeota archaeon]|nr:hypothetical protein [Candidatus Woesearchaeota archaeon]
MITKRGKYGLLLFLVLLSFFTIVAAHEAEPEHVLITETGQMQQYSIYGIMAAGSLAGVLVIITLLLRPRSNRIKAALFLGIIIPVAAATIYVTYATVYLNVISETGGPVHWHADFEVVVCGTSHSLVNAGGFSNLVGESLLHEHGDERIHVEGVLVQSKQASLQSFFRSVGGFLEQDQFVFPSEKGIINMRNGDICPSGKRGMVQVFVYRVHDKKMTQQKLTDYESYILSPYSTVPPGDCIIIEFDEPKERTERICESYKVALLRGDIYGG